MTAHSGPVSLSEADGIDARAAGVHHAGSAQAGLWAAQQLWPGSPVFVTGEQITFDSAPDLARLRAALRRALDEADVLRSRFVDGPQGVGFVLGAPIEIEEIDGAPADIAARALGEAIDPAADPCARVIIATGGPRVALLVIAHHIVLDAYGHMLLANRVARLYGEPEHPRALGSITSLPSGFDDPADDDREFWAEELAGINGPSTLAGRPRGHRIAARVRTSERVVEGITDSTGWQMRLGAMVAAFCGRRTGASSLCLGFPMMNRIGSPAATVPTTTVNVLPLRVPTPADATIAQITETMSAAVRRISPHSRYRGEQIVRDLRARGVDSATGPALNIKPFGSSLRFGDVAAQVRSLARGPLVDISVTAIDVGAGTGRPGALQLLIDADADLYTDDQVREIADALAAFLEDVTARGADVPIGSLPMSGAAERAAGIRAQDRRTAVATDPTTILERIARQRPDSAAVRCADTTLTFRHLDDRVRELSARLGVLDAEDTVALLVPRGVDLVVALLAVLRSGAAFLPLDPGFPADRISMTLDDAAPAAVIRSADGELVVELDAHHGAAQTLSGSSSPTVRPENPAYVIYTSGSTGRPKGVVVPHRALLNFAESMIGLLGYRPDGAILAVTTASFDISILELLVPLAAGATVLVATADEVHDPDRLARLLEGDPAGDAVPVVWMQATPSLWSAFLDAGHGGLLGEVDVLVGGEQLPPELGATLAGAARSVRNMYGPTETTIWSTTAPVIAGEPITIGDPIDNTGFRILDAALGPVASGQVGDLYLTGHGLARGYRGRPDLTVAAFVADPFGEPGTRMYRTGDLARIGADGTLECLGRADHQVKIRGFRVELGDVESALVSHPSVDRAVAAAVDGRLIGYILAAPGVEPAGVEELRERTAEVLPDYMVPATVVTLDAFPLTANGKVDRKALPAPDFSALAGGSRAPETDAERALAAVFAEVLGIDSLGAEDSFFLLGGDSISAVRVVAGAARAGWRVTALDVVDHPTIAGLARIAEAVDPATAPGGATPDVTTTGTTLDLDDDELDDLMEGSLL